MARKPSRIAGPLAAAISILGLLQLADRATAQDVAQGASPGAAIQTQYAKDTAAKQEVGVTLEAAAQSHGPKMYKNPFGAAALSPPMNVPLRPGPISRWQRSPSSAKQTAGITGPMFP